MSRAHHFYIVATVLALVTQLPAPTAAQWLQSGNAIGVLQEPGSIDVLDQGNGSTWILMLSKGNQRPDGSRFNGLLSVGLDANGVETARFAIEDRGFSSGLQTLRTEDGSVVAAWEESGLSDQFFLRVAKFNTEDNLAWGPIEVGSVEGRTSPLGEALHLAVTSNGDLCISTNRNGMGSISVVDSSGSLRTSGWSPSPSLLTQRTLVVPTLGDAAWLLQLETASDRLTVSPFDVGLLSVGDPMLIDAPVAADLLTQPNLPARLQSGEVWIPFFHYDHHVNRSFQYLQRIRPDGTTWFPEGGIEFPGGPTTIHPEFHELDSGVALVLAGAGRQLFRFDDATDPNTWGGSALLAESAGRRTVLQIRSPQSITALWDTLDDNIGFAELSADSLSGVVLRPERLFAANTNNRGRHILGATTSGSHGGVLIWDDQADLTRWPWSYDPGVVRAIPFRLVPKVRTPGEFDVWAQGEMATIRWNSVGSGTVDVDLSVDGGASWLPVASSIPDRPDSIRFEVPALFSETALVRVRRVDTDFEDISAPFRIRLLGEGFARSAGELRLAFDQSGVDRVASLTPFEPRRIYLLARADFSTMGHSDWNSWLAMGGWEAALDVDPSLILFNPQIQGPNPIDADADATEWAVGYSNQLTFAGTNWVPLMSIDVVQTGTGLGEQRVRIRPPDPSSFDNAGGPGPIPGWLERPASGECLGPCLRGFGVREEESDLAINPPTEGTPIVTVGAAVDAVANRQFVIPVSLDWARRTSVTGWSGINLSLYFQDASARVVDVRSTVEGNLRWRHLDGVLSIALDRYALPGATSSVFEVVMSGGGQQEILRPRLIDARVQSEGNVLSPLVDIQSSEVAQSVATILQDFSVIPSDGSVLVQWQVSGTKNPIRVLATDANRQRILTVINAGDPSGRIHDPEYSVLRTVSYALEVEESGAWTELAKIAAPTLASDLALSVEPNPVTVDSNIRFSLGRARSGRVDVFDLRGRRVREWSVNADDGRRAIAWNGNDAEGRRVAAGIYFVRLQTSDRVAQQKVLVVR